MFAKLLNLSSYWLFALGRLFNFLSYAMLVFLAYRISPVGKMPSRRLACFPCRFTWRFIFL
ncbi:MAG: DUF2142 domain-containing protein [Collinsella sp.]|nr:DUF2142 domain-containing protein [Collinsella sp.]